MVTVVVGHGNFYFSLMGHLGRWYKHTAETSDLLKISIGAKEKETQLCVPSEGRWGSEALHRV